MDGADLIYLKVSSHYRCCVSTVSGDRLTSSKVITLGGKQVKIPEWLLNLPTYLLMVGLQKAVRQRQDTCH